VNYSNDDISLAKKITDAIHQVIGFTPAGLHEPNFDGEEMVYLQECIDSTYVSSVGKFVDEFEARLIEFTGAKYAIATVNGTAALHIALLLADVKPNEEVLIPSLTFIATANAVSYCNAIPHFVDSESETLGIDSGKLREYLRVITEQRSGKCVNKKTGRVIKALVPMHTFGHPSDLEGLLSVAREFNLVLVEDAAESLGSFYEGQHTGTFGKMSSLSFNGNKIVTTGGGGALLTNDSVLAKRAKHITTTSRVPHKWEFSHDEVGFNYRMPNLNAALGCAQMEQLAFKLSCKRKLTDSYQREFSAIKGVSLKLEVLGSQSNYWLNALILDRESEALLDQVLTMTNNAGISTRPVWHLLNDLNPYRDCPAMDLSQSKSLALRIVNLPSSPHLSKNYA
jgi:perosamine synthetase